MSHIKKSIVQPSPIKNKNGIKKPTIPGKEMCKCKPKLICVAHQHTAIITAVNPSRNAHKAKECQTKPRNKKQYYNEKFKDFKIKIETASKSNQLKQKCSGGGCGGATTSMPYITYSQKQEPNGKFIINIKNPSNVPPPSPNNPIRINKDTPVTIPPNTPIDISVSFSVNSDNFFNEGGSDGSGGLGGGSIGGNNGGNIIIPNGKMQIGCMEVPLENNIFSLPKNWKIKIKDDYTISQNGNDYTINFNDGNGTIIVQSEATTQFNKDIKIPCIEVIPISETCKSVIQDILDEFNNEFTNPNNPLIDILSDLDEDLLKLVNDDIYSAYTLMAKEYIINHPKYMQCMEENGNPIDRDCSGIISNSIEPICLQYIETDENNNPIFNENNDFVYKDKEKFWECVNSHRVETSIPFDCPQCSEYIDEYGNPIEPYYTLCANVHCYCDDEVPNVCSGCEDYIETYTFEIYGGGNISGNCVMYTEPQFPQIYTIPVNSNPPSTGTLTLDDPDKDYDTLGITEDDNCQPPPPNPKKIVLRKMKPMQKPIPAVGGGGNRKKQIFVKRKRVLDSGDIIEDWQCAYDYCREIKCPSKELLTECDDCKNIKNPNEIITVDWKCIDCPSELKLATRYEDCVYRCLINKTKKILCPNCADGNWEDLGYVNEYECWKDKCKGKPCNDYSDSIFLIEPLKNIAKEEGFFSENYLNVLYEIFENPNNLKTYYSDYDNTTYEIFGKDSEEFRNYLYSFHGLKDIITNSDKEFLSKEYLKEAIKNNINNYILCEVNDCKENYIDVCIKEKLQFIDFDFWKLSDYKDETQELNAEICLPDILTINQISSLIQRGVYPVYVDKNNNGILESKFIIPDKNIEIKKYLKNEYTDEEILDYLKRNSIPYTDYEIYKKLVKQIFEVKRNDSIIMKFGEEGIVCEIYNNCDSIVINEPQFEEEEIEFKEPIKPKDIAKIEQLLENNCVDILDSIIDNDIQLKELFKEKRITNREQQKDYVKFQIMANADLVALIEYLVNECQEFNTGILEYLTNRKSIVEFEPDKKILKKPIKKVFKEQPIISETFIKELPGIIEIETPVVSLQISEKIILPKLAPAIDVIKEHLKFIEELHRYKTDEYLESLKMKIFIHPKAFEIADVTIDIEQFKKELVKLLDIPIDTYLWDKENKTQFPILLEVDIKDYVFEDLYNNSNALVILEVQINSEKIKEIKEKLNKLEDTEKSIKIEKFIKDIDELNNLIILEIPIDTFIWTKNNKTYIQIG